MKNLINKLSFVLILGTLVFSSCSKEEYLNPSQASTESVVKSPAGLIALCNGLQYKYTVSRTSPIYSAYTADALTTNQWIVLNQGNTDEANLQAGKGNLLGNNAVLTRLWEQSHLVKANADIIINGANTSLGDGAAKNQILCYAYFYKGMALMQLATFFEKAPLEVKTNATFVDRKELLKEAVRLFTIGRAAAASAGSFPSSFSAGINFVNAFPAMLARAELMLGNYDNAIAAVDAVDLKVKSTWGYDDIARNPIYEVHYSNQNVCEPTDSLLGLRGELVPSLSDGRLLFHLKALRFTNLNDGKGFFTSFRDNIPAYLPGEMILIKAECLARKNDVSGAVTELNKVLTKSDDVYGLNAKLPAYSGPVTKADVLTEIYRNRCIELYISGLRLEDSRRFERPAPNEAGSDRNRNFYPYPNSERDNNPNTPADPTI